jgi:thiopeptide-type bacteriocin biosynthesis protein
MIKRSFCLGSEWLYYKIYTGVKTADVILTEKLYPIISLLQENKTITKWFFIRYNDPDDHIRIRFNCDSIEKVEIVIRALYPIFDELIQQDLVWKLQTDTYQREIERYGTSTIEASESMFHFDSEMIIQYSTIKPYLEDEKTQLLFSFLTIDSLLNSFSLNVSEKLEMMNNLQESFKNEFEASKQLRKEFDKNYRELGKDIELFLSHERQKEYEEIYSIALGKKSKIEDIKSIIINNLQISKYSFLSSHIHMMLNRQYTSRQRTYECLIYDHLFRYYKKLTYFQEVTSSNISDKL